MSEAILQTDLEIKQQTATSVETQPKTHIRQLSYVRVLGLALVLTYHFWPKFLPGGFFGVDVFFVFSGYLITALALQEVRGHGSFDLGRFAQRRFFRIFPTVALAMLVVLPFVFSAPDTIRYQLREQVFAGLSFITNFYEISTGTSYANDFAPHIWVHLWSLALEVQFYILWGLGIWLLAKLAKNKAGLLAGFTSLVALVLLLISGLAMFIGSFGASNLSTLYYSLFTHVFPFFFGSLLATIAGVHPTKLINDNARKRSRKQIARNAILSGFGLIVLSLIFQFNWKATYFIGFGLAGIFALNLIFWLRLLHTKSDKPEPKIIIFLADISYGVYIFHWPFLTIFRAEGLSNLKAVLLTMVLSIIFSSIIFYLIDPLLQGKKKLHRPEMKWALTGLALLLLIPTCVALAKSMDQTSLEKSLWEANNQQASSMLSFADKYAQSDVSSKMTSIIIGDSETVQESQSISETYPNMLVDALSSRRIDTGLEPEIDKYMPYLSKDATLIIALGINSVYPDQDIATLKKVIQKYNKTHKIILVTPGNANEANQTEQSKAVVNFEISAAKTYSNVTVANWEAKLNGHSDWVSPDGIHPSGYPDGMKAWMDNLGEGIKASGAKI